MNSVEFYPALARELVRQVRGRRSQSDLSRRAGYKSNMVQRWEAGECFPHMETFLRVCTRQRINVAAAITRFYGRPPDWLADCDPTSNAAAAALLRDQKGRATLGELARRSGYNRYTLARWLDGRARPRLHEFLHVLDVSGRRLLDFVATLVDPAGIALLEPAWTRLFRAKQTAYQLPWSQAVLRALELAEYRRTGWKRPGWLSSTVRPMTRQRHNMKALFGRRWLLLAAITSFACGGGSTGDFTGDAVDCDHERLESERDEPVLGFSMSEILAASVGSYDVPVRWTSDCNEATGKQKRACADAAAFVDEWTGKSTTVHVEIIHNGAPAVVRYPAGDQSVCAQSMSIPVELRIESDDGLLDEIAEAKLWSECGTSSGVGIEQSVAASSGAIGFATSGLPEDWQLEVEVDFFGDRFWFGLYIGPSPSGAAVLTSDLPPFGERTEALPRTRVELQLGTPLPEPRACHAPY